MRDSFSSPPLAQDRHLDEVAVSLWRKLGLHMTKLMESRAAAWQADLNRPGGCLAAQPMTIDKKMVFRSPQYPGLVVKMSKALSDLHHEVVSMQHFHRFPKSDIWAQVPWTGSPFALDCHGQPMFAFVQQRIAGALVKPRHMRWALHAL